MFRFTGQRAVPEQLFQNVLEAIHNNIINTNNGIEDTSNFIEEIETPEEAQCPVCLENIQSNAVKLLHCEHIFHKNCIERWFQNHTTCPVCRMDYNPRPPSPQRRSQRRINVIMPYTVTLNFMYPNNTSMETTWSSDSTILDLFIYLRRQITMEHKLYLYFDHITFSTTESFDHLSNTLRYFRIFDDQTVLIRLI